MCSIREPYLKKKYLYGDLTLVLNCLNMLLKLPTGLAQSKDINMQLI